MGNCQLMCVAQEKQSEPTVICRVITRKSFKYIKAIGRGGFGKVWKVQYRNSKQWFALKEMDKRRVTFKKSVESVLNERSFLSVIRHPFIVNMQYAFHDERSLYLVMDLLVGGDMRYHLGNRGKFTEQETKFFVSCLICALEYVHYNGIVHGDIKPENLVLDNVGYLRLTDFGIARVQVAGNAHENSGTPSYMAPEVIARKDHTICADYFAVGVIVYEFMWGNRPFYGRNRREIREAMFREEIVLDKKDVPAGWSADSADLVTSLMKLDPGERLGWNGPLEVKEHPWFSDIDWDSLYHKKLKAPFIPGSEDNFDIKNVLQEWKEDLTKVDEKNLQGLFSGYFFDPALHSTETNEGN